MASSDSSALTTLPEIARQLYSDFGQAKDMGGAAPASSKPHFFLLRKMFGENDLLVILNTKRCRYQCHFCQLPAKSSHRWIGAGNIANQFGDVLVECKHVLSILDRVTLSNEGSVLDASTLPKAALEAILLAIEKLRRTQRVVLETRMEFVESDYLGFLNSLAPRARLEILTGFETLDERIRDEILVKREPLPTFCDGLDRLAQVPDASVTCYILFKPDPEMTDEGAKLEAWRSIDFLVKECGQRNLRLSVRLNPMYVAQGSRWAEMAAEAGYLAPRLTDVLAVARAAAARGIPTHIGLSSEGLATNPGTYMAREDYSRDLLKIAIAFNQGQDQALQYR